MLREAARIASRGLPRPHRMPSLVGTRESARMQGT
jgi:hypothetical protein